MLDLTTLRIVFGLVGLCTFLLCYFVSYRTTRSAFSRWWCVVVLTSAPSMLLYELNGTAVQRWANPLGNGLSVLAMAFVWAAARSLRHARVGAAPLLAVPVLVLAASLLDDPAHDTWAGGAPLLLGMGAMLGAAAVELVRMDRQVRPMPGASGQYRFALRASMLAAAGLGSFYVARGVALLVAGQDSRLFEEVLGPRPTTLINILVLVAASFNVSTISHEQASAELRRRATRDPLTELWNRSEFFVAAQRLLDHGTLGESAVLLVVDLDHFKRVNDAGGHAAGDAALVAFARCARRTVERSGICGRLGGDEFVVLLARTGAEDRIDRLRDGYRDAVDGPRRTLSIGAVELRRGDVVGDFLEAADRALYRAKREGRDRLVWSEQPTGAVGG